MTRKRRFSVSALAFLFSLAAVAADSTTTPDQVELIAREAGGAGRIVRNELGCDDGRVIHWLEMTDGDVAYMFEIDDASGEVLEFAKTLPAFPSAKCGVHPISIETAMRLVVTETGGAKPVRLNTEWEDGRLIHEVMAIGGDWRYEHKVDAASGRIFRYKRERIGQIPAGVGERVAVSPGRAGAIALERLGGGDIVELDFPGNGCDAAAAGDVYEIHIVRQGQLYKVKVGAANGVATDVDSE